MTALAWYQPIVPSPPTAQRSHSSGHVLAPDRPPLRHRPCSKRTMRSRANQPVCRSHAEAIFNALAVSKTLEELAEGFHQMTGLALAVVLPDGSRYEPSGFLKNPFCVRIRQHERGRRLCVKCLATLLRTRKPGRAAAKQECFARMIHVAVPIVVGGHEVATLLAGQVLPHPPNKVGLRRLRAGLVRSGMGAELPALEQLWLQSPIVSPQVVDGCSRLLEALASLLGGCAERLLIGRDGHEPLAVQQAKEFVRSHFAQPINLHAIAGHIGLSRSHCCRLFHKHTGLRLTEYLWHVRIEEAKQRLGDTNLSIKTIAFASGFPSVARFDHVFRRLEGVSPTRYRANLRQTDIILGQLN